MELEHKQQAPDLQDTVRDSTLSQVPSDLATEGDDMRDANPAASANQQPQQTVATIRTAGSAIGAMALEKSVREGNSVYIPSLQITITKDHLAKKP